MLQVEALTKVFGDFTALDGVSFSVAEGEIVGLLGENGAGKTTTLRILAGALYPTSGWVRIGGCDLLSNHLAAKRKVGYLPERLPLDDAMRVRPYLDYVARLRGLDSDERADSIDRVLDACHLRDIAERGIGVLSRGMRMRVALAQALVHNPELLLLDEPTAGLDPEQVINMRELIRSLAGHHTILFSSHNLNEVSECCSRVVLLRGGQVVAEDSVSVLTGLDGREETVFLRLTRPPDDLHDALLALEGVVGVEPGPPELGTVVVRTVVTPGIRERLVAEVVSRGWGLCEVRQVSDTLEDVFHRHAAGNGE
ncbi:MAG: ABC transporter ATP-binding protein [Nitrospirota bacterium]|nr:ABC transporter ATP-binding protein [Nitrospirota bacterium]